MEQALVSDRPEDEQRREKKSPDAKARTVSSIEEEIDVQCQELGKLRDTDCFPLLLAQQDIHHELVDKVFDDLTRRQYDSGTLDIIVASSGGDIDAAYNLALLFRRYGKKKLTFIVPRWAKSAATLLVCAGDEILMTPVAELGPLDPQITELNPLEQRVGAILASPHRVYAPAH